MLCFSPAGAPAESIRSANYTRSQSVYSGIYDGRYKASRPRTSVTPPVQLFHPAFGHFLDGIKSNEAPPDDIIRQTAEYMISASAIYRSEGERREELNGHLSTILGFDLLDDDKTGFILLEDKKDGGSLSDPSTRAGLSTGRYWVQSRYEALRNATCCPTFLVATMGPWIAVLGAVIIDSVIVQRLTDYIGLGLDSVINKSRVTDVARVFHALKTSLKRLSSYYENLKPTSNLPADTRYFPSITAYRHPEGGRHIKFKYVGYLENVPDCITLRARTETIPAEDIVIKFVDNYGERAHRILEEAGLAPKLLYYGSPRLDDDEPSYQPMSMVVMEFIHGQRLDVARKEMSKESLGTARSDIKRALELLHQHDLVFGDVRTPNVMITRGGKVKLIDFDWAGEDGQVKYPPLLSSVIAWPEGAKASSVIRKKHDEDMLEKLLTLLM